jgi:hypothetical protein
MDEFAEEEWPPRVDGWSGAGQAAEFGVSFSVASSSECRKGKNAEKQRI